MTVLLDTIGGRTGESGRAGRGDLDSACTGGSVRLDIASLLTKATSKNKLKG